MIPFPKTDYNEIIADLNAIHNHFDVEKFRFNLNEYKKKGISLIKKDPEMGFVLLGVIYCVEGRYDEMHSYHKAALDYSGESFFALSQYSCSLSNSGLMEEAFLYGLKAYELEPKSKDMLDGLMRYSYTLGMDDEYKKFKEKLIKLNFSFDDPDEFIEDKEETLKSMFERVDTIIEENPDLIVELDPEFEKLVDELVDGVDI